MAGGNVDLAILPSTIGNSPDWPVVAILRQNVMALIVPAPATPITAKKETSAPAKKETSTAEKKEGGAKGSKSARAGKGDKVAAGKNAKATKSDDAEAAEVGGDKSGEDAGETAAAGDKSKKVRQLVDRRVGVVTGNVATKDLLDVVLNHYGVPLDKVQVSLIDPKNLAEAVKANQVDAIFVAGAATGQAITDAIAAASRNGEAPSFIAIDQADGIAKRNPAFESADIDAGTFGGNPPSPDDSLKKSQLPRISGGTKVAQPRQCRQPGEADLFVPAGADSRDARRDQAQGAADRKRRRRHGASGSTRLSDRRSEILLR